jgi:hypothetical protein
MTSRGTEIRRVPFKSKTNPANSYEVIVWSSGELTCNCPGWTRRCQNGVRECKHTMVVTEMGQQAASAPSRSVSSGGFTQLDTRRKLRL